MYTMTMVTSNNIWTPIEGEKKKKRINTIGTNFSKKRSDHRNSILKDYAERLESTIYPKIPDDYRYEFDTKKCMYCKSEKIGKSYDEFRPITQRGRMNRINCVPSCGNCNASKNDKCGTKLIQWIDERPQLSDEEKQNIKQWYEKYEKYMIIPLDTVFPESDITYEQKEAQLDIELNRFYEMFKP